MHLGAGGRSGRFEGERERGGEGEQGETRRVGGGGERRKIEKRAEGGKKRAEGGREGG